MILEYKQRNWNLQRLRLQNKKKRYEKEKRMKMQKQGYIFDLILKKKEEKNGDIVTYYDKILSSLLYQFFKQIWDINLRKKIWLIKNNYFSYKQIIRLRWKVRKFEDILNIDWLANLSDRSFIKDVLAYKKKKTVSS